MPDYKYIIEWVFDRAEEIGNESWLKALSEGDKDKLTKVNIHLETVEILQKVYNDLVKASMQIESLEDDEPSPYGDI